MPVIVPAVVAVTMFHLFVVPVAPAVIVTIVITFIPVAVVTVAVTAASVLCLCSCIGCSEEEHHENQLFHSLLF